MSEFNFNFHNRSLDYLPVDGITRVYSRQVFNCIFSYVRPHSVLNPDVVAYSIDALHSLGMYRGKTTLSAEEEYELSMYMSGNLIPENATPYATNYCGYQFGTFAGQLGDGAAISLGEVISTEHLDVDDARLHNRGGDNSPVPCVLNRLELNIKGAGLTPFSRNADGRKVLRSSIREFLCSEAIHNLNIPTVRCASCVTSASIVDRDLHYDGNIIQEKCTIVSRTASNFFRFGSFELFQSASESQNGRVGPCAGNEVLKKKLLDHVIIYYLDEIDIQVAKSNMPLYQQWIKEQVPSRRVEKINGKASVVPPIKSPKTDENSTPSPVDSISNANSSQYEDDLLASFCDDKLLEKLDSLESDYLQKKRHREEFGMGSHISFNCNNYVNEYGEYVPYIDNTSLSMRIKLKKMFLYINDWPIHMQNVFVLLYKELYRTTVTDVLSIQYIVEFIQSTIEIDTNVNSAGGSGFESDYKKIPTDPIEMKYSADEVLLTHQSLICYLIFFFEVMYRTIKLVSQWQCIGFVHGVLNTDNMSIMGLTIDYGPYAFMELFDNEMVSNGSDAAARYSYGHQPSICKWNLMKLAEALGPVLIPTELSKAIITSCYDRVYEDTYCAMMCKKLGFVYVDDVGRRRPYPNEQGGACIEKDSGTDDKALINELLHCFSISGKDYTDTFVAITELIMEISSLPLNLLELPPLSDMSKDTPTSGDGNSSSPVTHLVNVAIEKIMTRSGSVDERMKNLVRKLKIHKLSMHPQQILDLYGLVMSEEISKVEKHAILRQTFSSSTAPIDSIIDEIITQKSVLDKLLTISQRLEALEKDLEVSSMVELENSRKNSSREMWRAWVDKYYARLLFEWKMRATPHAVSNNISNLDVPRIQSHIEHSVYMMKHSNPTFILRNWVAHEVIHAAEMGDYSQVRLVLQMVQDPYNYNNSIYKNTELNDHHLPSALPEACPSTDPNIISRDSSMKEASNMKDTSNINDTKHHVEADPTKTANPNKYIAIPPDWSSSLICTCSS